MKKLVSHSVLFVALLLTPMAVFGKENTKFHHRAGSYAHETRYERNCLSTFEVEVMGGRATKGYDSNKTPVNLLDIYGMQTIGRLGQGGIGDPGASEYNFDLANLLVLGSAAVEGGLGTKYAGKYTVFEANLYYVQNLCNGFFFDVNLPLKKLKVKDIVQTDATNADSLALFPGLSVAWATVYNDIPGLLAKYNLSNAATSTSGIGDIMVNGGWTCNNDDIESLDFFDTTIKVGVSIPTGKKRDENQAFAMALGYDGHLALSTSFDMAIGLYDWFTLGAHVGGMFFFNKTKDMRMNTTVGQNNGYFKLLKGNAKRDMGNIWDVGSFIKADHIFKGFSLMFGYNYVHKGSDTLTPENTVRFPIAGANEDPALEGYRMHAVSVGLEYDMAEEGRRFNPQFGLFYSRPIKGKRIFKTDTGGGSVGLNVAWDF